MLQEKSQKMLKKIIWHGGKIGHFFSVNILLSKFWADKVSKNPFLAKF